MKWLLILSFCLIVSLCQAQEQKRFSVGPTIGLGVAGWYEGPTEQLQSSLLAGQEVGNRFVPGYAVGMVGKYYLTSSIGVSASVLYVRGGSKLVNNYYTRLATGEPAGYTNESTLRFDFLRTPMALSWEITQTNVRPFLKIGAAPSWALGGYRNVYDHTIITEETREETQPLRLNARENRSLRYDWLFYTGVGIDIKQRLFVEANLFTGNPQGYFFAEPSACPPTADCLFFDKSYHRRTLLLTVSYGW